MEGGNIVWNENIKPNYLNPFYYYYQIKEENKQNK